MLNIRRTDLSMGMSYRGLRGRHEKVMLLVLYLQLWSRPMVSGISLFYRIKKGSSQALPIWAEIPTD